MKRIIFLLTIIISLYSCESLDVENMNEPDKEKVNSNPRDLKRLAEGAFNSYWQVAHNTNLYVTSLVAADQFTASWHNFNWSYVSKEPRIPWDNTITANDAFVTQSFYYNMYGVLSNYVNPVIELVNKGAKLGTNGQDNPAILSVCYMLQGMILGQLALSFDQAMIVKEDMDLSTVKFSKYDQVMASAIESLEKSIDLCNSNWFDVSADVTSGYHLNNTKIKQICHSYIARFMVCNSRTKLENNNVDWAKVLEHAQLGLDADFYMVGDATASNGGRWFDQNFYYLTNKLNPYYPYAFVDCRLLHMMDPDYPDRFPVNTEGKLPQIHSGLREGEASSIDKRLKTDFTYYPACLFYAERGYYNYSYYQYSRYPYVSTTGRGLLYDFRKYENDLYIAEANVMLNRTSKAISILNDVGNPRTNGERGALEPLPDNTSKDKVLDAIFYEREIELLGQGFMVGFCDMRRRDMLQYGTLLHYPIPGKELETLQMKYYTYGGVENADGVNTSNGGWFK